MGPLWGYQAFRLQQFDDTQWYKKQNGLYVIKNIDILKNNGVFLKNSQKI